MPKEKVPKELSKKKKAEISPIPVPVVVVSKENNKETAKKAEKAKKVRIAKPKSKMTDAERETMAKLEQEEHRLDNLALYDKLKKDRAQIPENLNAETLSILDEHINTVKFDTLTQADHDAEGLAEDTSELKKCQELQSKLKSDRMILLRTDNFESFVEVLTDEIRSCGDEIEELKEAISEQK